MIHPVQSFNGSTNVDAPHGRDAAPASSGCSAPAQPQDSTLDHERPPLESPLHMLEHLRQELDNIDGALLESLRQRLDCCVRIGAHKKIHAIPMMQPHRIGIVQRRAADFAATHGLNPAFLHALYALIIEETCRLEDEVIGAQEAS